MSACDGYTLGVSRVLKPGSVISVELQLLEQFYTTDYMEGRFAARDKYLGVICVLNTPILRMSHQTPYLSQSEKRDMALVNA